LILITPLPYAIFAIDYHYAIIAIDMITPLLFSLPYFDIRHYFHYF